MGFGAENFYIDLQRHLDSRQERLNRQLAALAAACRVPLVVTIDVCHGGADRQLLDVLACIRLKTTLEEAGRALWINNQRYLKPPAEMAALLRDLPKAIAILVYSPRVAPSPSPIWATAFPAIRSRPEKHPTATCAS